MPSKEFLEEYPLFKKFNAKMPPVLNSYPSPPINMKCSVCSSDQTFNMVNNYWDGQEYMNFPASNAVVRLNYLCQSCKNFSRDFFIYIGKDLNYIYKVGQYPEWEIKIDKNLGATLGKHTKNFKKGLVCANLKVMGLQLFHIIGV